MTDFPRRTPLWRFLILLPLPYLPLLGFAAGGAPWSANAPSGRPQPDVAVVLAVVATALGLLFVGLTWARSRALRVAGYLGYALALTLAFGVGGVLALMNHIGGLHGEATGPLWATIVLGTGAVLSILALVPLAALIVADWSQPRGQ